MYKKILVVVACVGLVCGCDKIPGFGGAKKPGTKSTEMAVPKGEVVVAKVGNFYITGKDLTKEVSSYNALVDAQGMTQNKIDTKEKKVAYLRNEVVRKYILYREALDRGLDKREDIVKALENARLTLLVSELVKEELEKITVSSQEVEEFYNQNKQMLTEPEQRKVSEILTATEDEAKQIYIELLKGGDFVALAKQSSKAASAANGGDIGFIVPDPDPKRRIRFDKFYEVAFAPSLEAGGISSIFKGPEGYYIIRLDTVKAPETKSLSELWDNIKSWLLFEKQQKAIADLANKLSGETKVEIYEGKVE